MNLPKVAIGIPVYNGEKYLRFALDSLLAQTYQDFHIYISDNASTDGTQLICLEYANKDSRIKYFKQPNNIGIVKNFDFVKVQSINYELFMWAAHDDYWDTNWLELLVNEMKPDDLGVRGNVVNVDQDGKQMGVTHVTSFNRGDVLDVFLDNEKNCRSFYYYALFNNDLLKKANFDLLNLDTTYGADTFFVCHLVQYGALRTVSQTNQYYRRHQGSTTNYYSKQWFGLKRLAFYLLPISTYIYTLKVVEKKYWLKIITVIPYKFIKSQFNIWPRIIKLIMTGSRL